MLGITSPYGCIVINISLKVSSKRYSIEILGVAVSRVILAASSYDKCEVKRSSDAVLWSMANMQNNYCFLFLPMISRFSGIWYVSVWIVRWSWACKSFFKWLNRWFRERKFVGFKFWERGLVSDPKSSADQTDARSPMIHYRIIPTHSVQESDIVEVARGGTGYASTNDVKAKLYRPQLELQ